jgi:hypothetical protein
MSDENRRIAAQLYRSAPLDFSLSTKGLAVTGGTNSASDLRAFIAQLDAVAALLPGDSSDER